MGGCATKPKVLKDDADGKAKAPEPEPEQPNKEDAVESKVVAAKEPPPQGQVGDNLNVNEIADDDQANKRRSLSLLFKENEDAMFSAEDEKTSVEETVKEETLSAEKPAEDTENNEPIVKQESPKLEEKLSGENKSNEPTKQEFPGVEVDEKPSVQNQSNKPAVEIVKTEASEAEKPSEETRSNEPSSVETVVKPESDAQNPSEKNNQSSEPLKEEHGEAKEKSSEETHSNEPIKQEPSEAGKPSWESEKNDSEAEKSEVVPLPEEKVIEVVLTDSKSVEKITEEATSNIEEKSHIGVEAEQIPKAADAGTEIPSKPEI